MFINCKKTLEFMNPETGEIFQAAAGYLGKVPEWVPKLPYFDLAVQDATITYVGDVPARPVDEPEKSRKKATSTP